MKIIHLKHDEINYSKWDNVMSAADNSLIYGFSWYLDCVSPQWEALVDENFEYIMPLPVKRKKGLKYIVQPILTQQLGIFSKQHISESIVKKFVRSIPYLSYEMNLNENNFISHAVFQPNFILSLDAAYEELIKNFSTNTLRNIRKGEKCNLLVNWELTLIEFIQFFFEEEKNYSLPDKNTTIKLVESALKRNQIKLVGIKTINQELIAVLGLIISGNRLIYLLPSSNIEGKEKAAMFLMVNEIIKKYAGTDSFFHFEGSKIDGIARFYKGFGAVSVPYYTIKRFRPHFIIGKL
jgi:hypothetical protein